MTTADFEATLKSKLLSNFNKLGIDGLYIINHAWWDKLSLEQHSELAKITGPAPNTYYSLIVDIPAIEIFCKQHELVIRIGSPSESKMHTWAILNILEEVKTSV